MPITDVLFYKDLKGGSPVVEWLKLLRKTDSVAWANCVARIQLLAESGHELRRPAADLLRDGIYELRAKHRKVQYRILYFFHGKNVAILAHAITKKDTVPAIEIDRAVQRMRLFKGSPSNHTYEEESNNV